MADQNHIGCDGVVVAKDSGELVGRCGLLPWEIDGRTEVEVAYLLGTPWWGRGLATEAANLSKAQILLQAGVAALAQANSAPQQVLSLLRA